jgi:tryptophan-rich sensory protein
MIILWLVTAGIAALLAFAFNRLFPSDFQWFQWLRRPAWLTFEGAIPFIWTTIFLCGITSAALVWKAQGGNGRAMWLMAGYMVVEVAILAYMPVMCSLRSLKVGAIVGATGWVLGGLLCLQVWPISAGAGALLLPFLLWSPIGTYVTWVMVPLNPDAA